MPYKLGKLVVPAKSKFRKADTRGMWDTLYVCDLILSSNILFIKEKEKNLRFTLSNNNYDSRKPHFTDANPGKY